jgi:phage FluMu protein Com
MFELILIPLVMVIYFFSYPPIFVGSASGIVVMIWLVTSIASPRKFADVQDRATVEETTLPTIGCPACKTVNLVTSDERPLRIACTGCGRTIKIVG